VTDLLTEDFVMRVLASAALVAAGAVATPAFAHHSFAMFDASQTVVIEGVVTEVQWTNPHVWVEVEATDDQGRTREYEFEGGAIAVLKANGWTRETLHAGDQVVVRTHPFREDRPGGSLEEVTLPDGTVLRAGNGIPGALVVGASPQ
jgi:hypothetical protein